MHQTERDKEKESFVQVKGNLQDSNDHLLGIATHLTTNNETCLHIFAAAYVTATVDEHQHNGQ